MTTLQLPHQTESVRRTGNGFMQKGTNESARIAGLLGTVLSFWWQLVGDERTSGATQGMSHRMHVNKHKTSKTLCCSNVWPITKDVSQLANKAL